MNGIDAVLDGIAEKAARTNSAEPGDYEFEGLLYCGKCRTAKQTVIEVFGAERKVGCMCKCATERRDREYEKIKERERLLKIHSLRVNGIQDRTVRNCTFESSNGANKEIMGKCKRYVDNWQEMLEDNIGLVMWGDTGNGKTYAAACIANALIDRGIPVLMTSFARLLAAITGMFSEERVNYLDSLSKFKLLIIDDLGAERQSEFALEQVYSVIDARYKSKQPLIVTTNLPMAEMKSPKDMGYKRIYDRVLEMCVPMHFKGESMRRDKALDKMKRARELLGSD